MALATREAPRFGTYSKKCKKEAIAVSQSCEFSIFEFLDQENKIKIVDLSSGEIVYVYKPN